MPFRATLLCLALLFPTLSLAQTLLPPIFSSTAVDPDQDPALRQAFAAIAGTEPMLFYGSNHLKSLILQGSPDQANSYESIRALAAFIIQNSQHDVGILRPLDDNIDILFYSAGPLLLSCGKISSFFRQLITTHMGVLSKHIRYVPMYDERALDPASVQLGYLDGGHTVVEIYFPALSKWVVMDLDKGMLPTHNGIPLSMLEIRDLPATEVNFMAVGVDQYRKGPTSEQQTNSYYQAARYRFGINDKAANEYVFLFDATEPEQVREQFRQNFMASNPSPKVTITTDRAAYIARFYTP